MHSKSKVFVEIIFNPNNIWVKTEKDKKKLHGT